MERAILDAVDADLPGFRAGWIGTFAAEKHLKASGVRVYSMAALERTIEAMGYHLIGRAEKGYFQEEITTRPMLYNLNKFANPNDYGLAQGYGYV